MHDPHQKTPGRNPEGGEKHAQPELIADRVVTQLGELFRSKSWKLAARLMRLMMRPKSLGAGRTLLDDLQEQAAAYQRARLESACRIAIKVPVPRREVRNEWGDYHFGQALAGALRGLGYAARVDILPDWDAQAVMSDQVVIVLRGLGRYQPRAEQINLMWHISHPELPDDAEFEQFDHVFVASEGYATTLASRINTPVTALLQCADTERFTCRDGGGKNTEVVFVGNSRGHLRPIVRDAIAAGLKPRVFGTHWRELIEQRHIAGGHIDNRELGDFYARSGVVLNDHWPEMRTLGFVSNRLFDAAACGATVISDEVAGLEELFDGLVPSYAGGGRDLQRLVAEALEQNEALRVRRRDLAARVAREHSFSARAEVIAAVIERLRARRA